MTTKLPTLLREPLGTTVIGKPQPRVVGRDKVTGGVRYSAEIAVDNPLFAFPVTSKVAAGRVTAMQARQTEALPGVVKVYTHDNLPELGEVALYGLAGRAGSEYRVMQSDEIRYDGQMVAVIVAETIEAGEQGVYALEAEFSSADASATLDAGEGEQIMSDARGDLEAGRREGEVSVEVTLHQPVHHHNPMEPPATTAVWNGPQLTVYEPSQGVTALQTFLGRALKMPVENIRVVADYIGGGFGVKGTAWFHTPVAALIARDLERPVKMLPSREDMYGVYGNRPASEQTVRVSAKRDGTMTAYEMTSKASTSITDNYVAGAMVSGHLMINACPNASALINLVRYNTNTPVPMRSPGEAESHFAHSVAVDVLAAELGMDPLAVHEANYAETDLHAGVQWSAKHLREAWTAAADRFGWDKRKATPGAVRDGDYYVGMGMSVGAYPGYQSVAMAKVRYRDDGRVEVLCGSQSLGQGNYTIMAQAAAEVLGIDAAEVRVSLGDTDLPRAQLSGGSRSSSAVTAGVMNAANNLHQTFCDLAANDPASPLKSHSADALSVEGRRIFVTGDPDTGIPLEELLAKVHQEYVEGYGEWGGKELSPYKMSRLVTGHDFLLGPVIGGRSSYSFVATFAEVRVHRLTGMYQISRIVSGYDCGRVINPKLAESQCKGGIIFAVGMACSEETAFDPVSARIVNGSIADYHVPVNADVPDIEVLFVNEPDDYVHPVGVKGIGEVAGTGAAAAITNAMYNATGVRVTQLPAYPEQFVGKMA